MHVRQKFVYTSLGCVLLLSGAVLLINAQVQSAAKEWIVFTSYPSRHSSNREIYIMDADGQNLQRLTGDPAIDAYPSWSPDGQKIAFSSDRDGNDEIYIMDVFGRDQQNLTNHPGHDVHPSWSPDGQRIAFVSSRDINREIYVMDADGKNLQRLTYTPIPPLVGSSTLDRYPSWSPDGQRITFESHRDKNAEIYVMDADGQNQQNLTNHPADDRSPSWSPDGQKIAFESKRDENYEIYVMDSDGRNLHRLTDHPEYDGEAAWFPNGQKIAFTSDRDGNAEIYIMDADGKNQQRLTDNAVTDSSPDCFDPAFAYAVSPAGKLRATWGWLKQNSK
jgi:Tol biopolymer transport system component